MFPAAMAATFPQNVVHRGILALFQFLLGLATFSNGLPVPHTVRGRDGSQVVDYWVRILVTIYGAPHRRFLEFPQIFPHLCFFSISAILVNYTMRNSPKF